MSAFIPFSSNLDRCTNSICASISIDDVELDLLKRRRNVRIVKGGGEVAAAGRVTGLYVRNGEVELTVKLTADVVNKVEEGVLIGLVPTAEAIFLVDHPSAVLKSRNGTDLRKSSADKSDELLKNIGDKIAVAEAKRIEAIDRVQKTLAEVLGSLKAIEEHDRNRVPAAVFHALEKKNER